MKEESDQQMSEENWNRIWDEISWNNVLFPKSSRKTNEGWKDNSYVLLLGEKEGGGCGQKIIQLHLV